MRKLIAIVFFLALPACADDHSMVEDARVTSAAVREWGKTYGADAKVTVGTDHMGIVLVGPMRLSQDLLASGIDRTHIEALVENLYERNGEIYKRAALPHRNGSTQVRTFRPAIPGYDKTRQHALVLGTVDDGWIHVALLNKVSEEEWQVLWTSRQEMVEDKPYQPDTDLTKGPPYRVGGDVKAPVVVRRVEPHYPEDARAARIQGIVILETIISKEGRVTSVNVLKTLPSGLGQSAVDAVKQWEFKPGTLNGEPVDVIFNLTIAFRLSEKEKT